MKDSINLYMEPTLDMCPAAAELVIVQANEASQILANEDGDILQPDP